MKRLFVASEYRPRRYDNLALTKPSKGPYPLQHNGGRRNLYMVMP